MTRNFLTGAEKQQFRAEVEELSSQQDFFATLRELEAEDSAAEATEVHVPEEDWRVLLDRAIEALGSGVYAAAEVSTWVQDVIRLLEQEEEGAGPLVAAVEQPDKDVFAGYPTPAEEKKIAEAERAQEKGLTDENAARVKDGEPVLASLGFPDFVFRGSKNTVLARLRRLIGLAQDRKDRAFLQEAYREGARAGNAYGSALSRQFGTDSYGRALEGFLENSAVSSPADIPKKTVTAWRKALRAEHASSLEGDVKFAVERLRVRGIPLPPAADLRRMVRAAVTETLTDTDDLLQTVQRARFLGDKAPFPLSSVRSEGKISDVAQSLGQRAADRIERSIVERGVADGKLQAFKRWQVDDPQNSRHKQLNGQVRRLDQGFALEPGSRVTYYGPRDRRMDARQGSLSRSFLQYRLVGDISGIWV